MSTEAKPGIGAKLRRWDSSASVGVWDTIAEVTAISVDGITREVIEVFPLDSSDDYVAAVQGVLNANTITITINYKKTQFAEMKTDMETRGDVDYQIVLPDGEGIEWAGFVIELPLAITSDDVMQGDIVIRINGRADFVSAASSSPS